MSRVLILTISLILSLSAQAAIFNISTPAQSGVSITTILDTDTEQLSYVFDFTSLSYDYENIAFSPSPLPAFSGIPLQAGAVASPGSTEWNFHQIRDGGNQLIGWSLELQYQTGAPPPRSNSIVINYDPSVQLTGNFLGQQGDDNFQVTYRRPAPDFPPGQEDNITFWAYVPEIQAIPLPPALMLFSAAVIALIGISGRRNYHKEKERDPGP